MKSIVCHVRLVLDNRRALRALQSAAADLATIADDLPWRPKLRRAANALRYAAKHLKGEWVKR